MEDFTEKNYSEPIPHANKVEELSRKIREEIGKVVIGQQDTIDLLLVGLFTGGHILLEGVPGIAKTLTAKMLSQTISAKFSRIQFTPDLMPSDILGASVYNMKTAEFVFNQGPVFANIILIDEINRSPAKTQSALFEVMEEGQVSIDGLYFKMEQPFLVLATQNPIEQEGTYRLPEAQLDRFLFRLKIDYPSLDEELEILKRFKNDFRQDLNQTVNSICSMQELQECKQIIQEVLITDELLSYIAQIVHATRTNGELFLGASPRASLAIMKASKALAAMNGRNFVTPDDISTVCMPVLNHRIVLQPEKEMEGKQTESVIAEIIKGIAIPR
jgi:MoxR-like ATPase